VPATDPQQLLHQLAVGDPASVARLVEASGASDDAATVVAAALFGRAPGELLTRAAALARTTRERQLVTIATAHLRGDRDLVDALAREHLADHPDSVLVAWIAAAAHHDDGQPHPSRITKE
jgi:class 3 adenylate cyclase